MAGRSERIDRHQHRVESCSLMKRCVVSLAKPSGPIVSTGMSKLPNGWAIWETETRFGVLAEPGALEVGLLSHADRGVAVGIEVNTEVGQVPAGTTALVIRAAAISPAGIPPRGSPALPPVAPERP